MEVAPWGKYEGVEWSKIPSAYIRDLLRFQDSGDLVVGAMNEMLRREKNPAGYQGTIGMHYYFFKAVYNKYDLPKPTVTLHND
jgi:hypothetical protein